MNPYAAELGSRDAIEVLSSGPDHLQKLVETIGTSRMDQSLAPGKWCPRQIVIHLADCELAFGFRYRQALGEDNHVVQPFDQDLWAKSYDAYELRHALQTHDALREWNLALLRSLKPDQMRKRVRHPERGDLIFRELIEIAAGHELHHMAQLEGFCTDRI